MNGPSRAQADPRGQMPVRPPREDEHASLSRSASPSSPTQSRPLQSLDAQVAGRTSQDQQLPYPGVTQRSPPQQQQTLQDQPKSPPAEAQTQSVPNAAPELARSAHPSDKWLLAALSEAHSSGFRPSDSQVQRALDTLRSEKSTATSDQQLMSIIVSLKEELANAKVCVSAALAGSSVADPTGLRLPYQTSLTAPTSACVRWSLAGRLQ